MEVFRIFFAICSLEFAHFCTKPSLWSRKKLIFRIFWENSKMALFGQIWVIFDLTCQLYIACGFQLNLFILHYFLIFPNVVFQVISRYP